MSIRETRGDQMFPVLDAGQTETAKRFASGPAREFAPGDIVYDVGERQAPAWLVLKGAIDVTRRDGLNREVPITTHHVGQISGEVSQLAGRESLACGRAGEEGCTAIPFDAAHVRALMIGSADIGDWRKARRVVLARCWSALPAPRISLDLRAFSAAMDIPTRCSTRPPRTDAR